jgi:hypothetical protein
MISDSLKGGDFASTISKSAIIGNFGNKGEGCNIMQNVVLIVV